MATINSLEVRSLTRIRVNWASSSGVPNNASDYVLVSLDSRGAPPTVSAVLLVSGMAAQREIVLAWKLVGGAQYRLDSSSSQRSFTVPESRPAASSVVKADHWDLEFYGVDISFDQDLREDASGDLATVAGFENGKLSVVRQATGNGLPWNPSWGGMAGEWVDAPSPALVNVHGGIVRQLSNDDRVSSVDVTPGATDVATGAVEVRLDVTFGNGASASVGVPLG
jgi:hypothetical protein